MARTGHGWHDEESRPVAGAFSPELSHDLSFRLSSRVRLPRARRRSRRLLVRRRDRHRHARRCGPGTDATNDAGADATVDAGPASGIWPADRTKLVASETGGFSAGTPDGSTCTDDYAASYELTIATKTLAWTACLPKDAADPASLFEEKTGARELTDAELASLDAAMNALTVATDAPCGADKSDLRLEVTSASTGAKTYVDSFYVCNEETGVTYVDGIDAVFSALEALAK